MDEIEATGTQVLAISTDPIPSVEAWALSLGGISYPLLSDFWPHGQVGREYGVLRENESRMNGHNSRTVLLIDGEGVISSIDVRPELDVHAIEPILESLRSQ